eukprot:m.5692 g.5692  ORF g.5692 m.5692 type:complete len:50 (+) comp4391_c0_seq1:166-315(+)
MRALHRYASRARWVGVEQTDMWMKVCVIYGKSAHVVMLQNYTLDTNAHG